MYAELRNVCVVSANVCTMCVAFVCVLLNERVNVHQF